MPTKNKLPLRNYRFRLPAFLHISLALMLAGLACNITIPDELNWYVATDGNDRNPCLTPEEPCLTIHKALERATDDDIIHIGPGTFQERPLLIEEHITLEGDGRDTTIIDFDGGFEGVRILGANRVSITDLAIRNVADSEGAVNTCLYIQSPAISVRLEDVKITNCAGAGIYVNNPRGGERVEISIIDSLIGENARHGIWVFRTDMEIIRSTIYENGSHAIEMYNSGLELLDSDVEHNQVTAIQLWGGSILVTGSRIQNNGEALRTIVEAFGEPFRAVNAGIHLGHSDEPGSATIRDSVIARNIDGVTTDRNATLTIERTRIEANLRTGVKLWSGNLTMSDVDVIRNGREELAWYDETGGVTVRGGTGQISNSTISGNLGGILVHDGATLLLDHSTISRNAGLNDGGITNQGELEILNSTINGNQLLINDGRLVAAGVMNFAKLLMENSTISGNRGVGLMNATYDMRDPSNVPNMTLNYVTIADNEAAGLSFRQIIDPSTLRINNSLIVNNIGSDCIYDRLMTPMWGGTNMDTDSTCGLGATLTSTELSLGVLRDNGGNTQTHALTSGSSAIDAASGVCEATDQRDEPRPSAAEECDVGAYETVAGTASGASPESSEGDEESTERDDKVTVIITENARCRTGPGFVYEDYEFLSPGDASQAIGRNQAADWFLIESLRDDGQCWIGSGVLEFDVVEDVLLALVVIAPPPTPIPTKTPTPTPDPDEGNNGQPPPPDNQGGSTTPPAAPANAYIANQTCTSQEYKVKLAWSDQADNEDGYRIYRDGQLIATLGIDSQEYTDNPPYGGPYNYTIEAFNSAGTSSSSVQEPGCLA
ncbi:MAG: DUF1565 domain-containing protein [Chloroflexi bacterium]|nr:MAG: DUF1565 domain-containing protein [Chloroflexota bacterium]MBL1195090.1 DUF1565 domain-containing protein [Chloroflexota bacterium]NOH12377.1 DUF1565 domain-containing protein [Chloroflexota bacterium]